jgi:chromate transporter
VSAPVIPKLRRSRIAGGVLDGVNIASLALMAVTTARLAGVAIVDPVSGLLGAGALVALAFSIAGPAWLMLVGAVVGLLTSVIVL